VTTRRCTQGVGGLEKPPVGFALDSDYEV